MTPDLNLVLECTRKRCQQEVSPFPACMSGVSASVDLERRLVGSQQGRLDTKYLRYTAETMLVLVPKYLGFSFPLKDVLGVCPTERFPTMHISRFVIILQIQSVLTRHLRMYDSEQTVAVRILREVLYKRAYVARTLPHLFLLGVVILVMFHYFLQKNCQIPWFSNRGRSDLISFYTRYALPFPIFMEWWTLFGASRGVDEFKPCRWRFNIK